MRELHTIVSEIVDAGSGLYVLKDDIGIAQQGDRGTRDRTFLEVHSYRWLE